MAKQVAIQSTENSITLRLLAIAQWAFGLGFIVLTWQFYTFYWQYRHELSLEDRYYHPEALVVYHAQSKFILVPALLCLDVFIILHYVMLRVRLKATGQQAQNVSPNH